MPGSRHALVVATDEYLDGSLRGLSSPASDAEALAEVLGDPALGQFAVEVLHNEESRDIAVRLEELLTESRPQDVVLIHFSCHGLKDDSGHLYLAARDTLPTRLWSTAVDATFVNRLIRKSRAGQVLLLLDCCYGGAFERGMVARAAGDVDVGGQFQQEEELSSGRGRAVITASSAMEYAFEGARLQETSAAPQPSVFTTVLTEGLRTGEADRDQDGLVSLGELYDHVYDRVREVNPKQTPGKWEYGTQGELVVARNPNRRLKPVSLPSTLQELVSHPFSATRHGAVQELRKLAEGTNLPLAAAARAELVRLQSDDSRQVCAAAQEAVEATQVGVDEAEVDFGTVEQGHVATRVVELQGVPLVDASKARAEGEGLTVRQLGRRVTIELDTSEPRLVEGSVRVDGPASGLVIAVHGSVTGAPAVDVEHPIPAPEPEPEPRLPPQPEPVELVSTPAPDEVRLDPGYAAARRWARVSALVIGLATVGSFVSLFTDWSTGSRTPQGPPHQALVAAGAASYLLPLGVLLLAAVLLWFRGPTPVTLGVAAGSAGAALVVVAQRGAALTFDGPDWAPSTAFWLACASRLVALAGALLAVWHAPVITGGTRYAGRPVRTVAAVVVLTAVIGGYWLAGGLRVIEIAKDQLLASLTVALIVGLLAVFLAVSPSRRQTLLAAVTALCVIVVLSDLQHAAWWLDRAGSAKWQAIDAAAFTAVLLVAWVVQGPGAFGAGQRRRREATPPG